MLNLILPNQFNTLIILKMTHNQNLSNTKTFK